MANLCNFSTILKFLNLKKLGKRKITHLFLLHLFWVGRPGFFPGRTRNPASGLAHVAGQRPGARALVALPRGHGSSLQRKKSKSNSEWKIGWVLFWVAPVIPNFGNILSLLFLAMAEYIRRYKTQKKENLSTTTAVGDGHKRKYDFYALCCCCPKKAPKKSSSTLCHFFRVCSKNGRLWPKGRQNYMVLCPNRIPITLPIFCGFRSFRSPKSPRSFWRKNFFIHFCRSFRLFSTSQFFSSDKENEEHKPNL